MSRDSQQLKQQALELFRKTFGGREPAVVAKAPGRVNLIGEHTDYSEGFCLPVALSLSTYCCLEKAPGGGSKCTIVSTHAPDSPISFNVGENAEEDWGKYVAGVAAQYGVKEAFNASFSSNIPLGGGLSSSAALDVSFATALEYILDKDKVWDPIERALHCVKGDHTYVGVPCGIMDQFASSVSHSGHALLIDCRSNTGTLISFEDPEICLVVTNTNVKHSHSGGEYGARVRECQQASKELGVPFLRDITDTSKTNIIQDEVARRRAYHVVSENDRTLNAVQAAQVKDWKSFGLLMNDSHESLRSNFEVSCPELDYIVSIARATPGVFGSRMTGGGFGGCTVTLVRREEAESLVQK